MGSVDTPKFQDWWNNLKGTHQFAIIFVAVAIIAGLIAASIVADLKQSEARVLQEKDLADTRIQVSVLSALKQKIANLEAHSQAQDDEIARAEEICTERNSEALDKLRTLLNAEKDELGATVKSLMNKLKVAEAALDDVTVTNTQRAAIINTLQGKLDDAERNCNERHELIMTDYRNALLRSRQMERNHLILSENMEKELGPVCDTIRQDLELPDSDRQFRWPKNRLAFSVVNNALSYCATRPYEESNFTSDQVNRIRENSKSDGMSEPITLNSGLHMWHQEIARAPVTVESSEGIASIVWNLYADIFIEDVSVGTFNFMEIMMPAIVKHLRKPCDSTQLYDNHTIIVRMLQIVAARPFLTVAGQGDEAQELKATTLSQFILFSMFIDMAGKGEDDIELMEDFPIKLNGALTQKLGTSFARSDDALLTGDDMVQIIDHIKKVVELFVEDEDVIFASLIEAQDAEEDLSQVRSTQADPASYKNFDYIFPVELREAMKAATSCNAGDDKEM